ncbi:hypothetical protein T233_00121 [Vagococcus lutrae LBD1]|uniref:Phospholipase/carboxylesterase/thioesterase domain-containing protein n=1 Tax=Vagococcus lutrae LBD1 TaxID=1408226 RepID=V6Q848_9ENTE|nr:hypothetical protein [Vagococcus lutrae]EST90850.1 hypothetical protein T233_00121 [Vagococcus lutrae LBD1]
MLKAWFTADKESSELIITFHGTGGNIYSLLPITGEIAPNADVLSFEGSWQTGRKRRYFPLPEEEPVTASKLKEYAQEFLQEFEQIDISRYEKVTAMGYSNGANYLLSILQIQPNFVENVILLHPADFQYEFQATSSDTRILATVGANDYIAPAGPIIQMQQRLQTFQFPNFKAKLLDGGHGISTEEIDFLKQYY